MLTVSGAEIRVGDTFTPICNDSEFFVAALEPYTGPLLDLLGAGTQIAETVNGTGRHPMTIPANSRYRLLSRSAA